MSSVERLDAKSKTSELASYSRAVKVGDFIFVSGTLGRNSEGDIPNVGDAGGQTEIILQRIENALKEMNAGLDDVVETRIFVADIKNGKALVSCTARHFEKQCQRRLYCRFRGLPILKHWSKFRLLRIPRDHENSLGSTSKFE